MGSRLHAFVERLLPWYQPAIERQREARSRRIVRHSEIARLRAARVIDEYQRAEEVVERQ